MRLAALLVACLLAGYYAEAKVTWDPSRLQDWLAQQPQKIDGTVCVVIRTYWRHGLDDHSGLRRLIKSLQRQRVASWEALLVVMDGKPFSNLHTIVQETNDSRVWAYAEWIGAEFAPVVDGKWSPAYHYHLYSLTDEAVRACPRDTKWVLITNGDNEYADGFFERLAAAPDADIVAFDFYSRYQRITARPCERFAMQEGAPPCKVNKLRWCHTDLGANVLSFPKLIAENRRFSALGEASGLGAEHFDGVLVETLVAAGWQAAQFANECLFDHSPSAQGCAREGGVWDESESSALDKGGRCLSVQEAAEKLAAAGTALEEVSVMVSNDGHLSRFEGGPAGFGVPLRCLRDANVNEQHKARMAFYGTRCSADEDIPLVEAHHAALSQDVAPEEPAALSQQVKPEEPAALSQHDAPEQPAVQPPVTQQGLLPVIKVPPVSSDTDPLLRERL